MPSLLPRNTVPVLNQGGLIAAKARHEREHILYAGSDASSIATNEHILHRYLLRMHWVDVVSLLLARLPAARPYL